MYACLNTFSKYCIGHTERVQKAVEPVQYINILVKRWSKEKESSGPRSKRIKMQFFQKDGRESCIEGKNIFPVSKFHKYEGKIQKQLKYI